MCIYTHYKLIVYMYIIALNVMHTYMHVYIYTTSPYIYMNVW